MGMKGRPSVPAKIKELSGTLRKDRTREGVQFEDLTIVPKPESWLDRKAKMYFVNMCQLLISVKLLDSGNVQLVTLMAQEFARYEKAQKEIRKTGEVVEVGDKGYMQPSPWVAISNQAQKNYRDIATLFGMDPMSKQKIGPMKKDDKDPFDELNKKYGQ